MIEQDLSDAILRHALDLQRVAANDAREADAILAELAKELRALLAQTDLTAAAKTEINALIKQAEDTIGSSYDDISGITDTEKLAKIVGGHTVEVLKDIFPSVQSATVERLASLAKDVLIYGAPASAWWARQSETAQFKFAQAVRQGVLNGETQAKIVARVTGPEGFLDVSRRDARKLVHSSVMTAANRARLETFAKNADLFRGVRYLATLDSHTCLRCAALDGAEWDFEGKPLNGSKFGFQPPPLHTLCRCVLSPIPKRSALEEAFPGISKRIDETAMRASKDGPVKNQSFAEFLKRQSPEFVEGTLGKRRAELFLAGKLTLTDLVSGTGRELALDELKVR